jgi:hypothetical protein
LWSNSNDSLDRVVCLAVVWPLAVCFDRVRATSDAMLQPAQPAGEGAELEGKRNHTDIIYYSDRVYVRLAGYWQLFLYLRSHETFNSIVGLLDR